MPDTFDDPTLAEPHRVLIVVGAHPLAEMTTRAVAADTAIRIVRWAGEREPGDPAVELSALLLTDLWYLNDNRLRDRPVICIGNPRINALSAYLADKLPTAYVVDRRLMVQVDLDMVDLKACCWGETTDDDADAASAFCDRYLDSFLTAAARVML